MDRKRLDKALVEDDFASSRSRAQKLIKENRVLVDGFPAEKAATLVGSDDNIKIKGDGPTWVGRGAEKIWPFIEKNWLSPNSKICLDVGSSTGGFTQALLKAGAEEVLAVDVGYGQLSYKLRTNDSVQVYERTNFRHSNSDDFDQVPSVFTMDVSFISTLKLLEALNDVMDMNSEGIVLVKPQFEAGPDQNEDGIVTDPDVRLEVLRRITEVWNDRGWGVKNIAPSPLQGDSGNYEYIVSMERRLQNIPDSSLLKKLAYNPSENLF